MILFMWHIKLPVILLRESKKSLKTLKFKYRDIEQNTFFFIRIGRKKKKFTFNLLKQTLGRIKIETDILKTDTIKNTIESNTLDNFDEYLINKIKFH